MKPTFISVWTKSIRLVGKLIPLNLTRKFPPHLFRLSNPNIRKFMTANHMTNSTDLMTYYSRKILSIMETLGAKSMVWQDVWDDGVKLPLDTIIEVWKDTSLLTESPPWSYYLSKATSEGYQTVLAAPFYLNM